MYSSLDKAVAAFVGSVLYMLGAFGMEVQFMQDQMSWLVPAVNTFLVWLVPNTET